ncbi:dTMP kinase [Mesoplasma photuris]|uniref:dTMP kinase n=1 Tax=Mesoplasma photuris TaxID=217731 RepID=UPI0004E11259|nr:dTMP kinase [Mesoplasma photuris]
MFITLEGMDGSGKTTAIKTLKSFLEKQGYEVLMTREPGGHKISEEIRNLVLSDNAEGIHPWTEALLYIASRKEHIDKVILPALKENKIVICDRYMDSTSAYQGHARGIGIDVVDSVQHSVLDGCVPDLTVYFDISLEESNKRLTSRDDEKNRLDREGSTFKEKVEQGYKILINKYPERFKVVDASQSIKNVQEQTNKIILEAIKNYEKRKSNR